jgi:hypothetical protein
MPAKTPLKRSARSIDRAENLESRIAALSSRPRSELVEEWIRIYGRRPPKYIKRGLIERAISWHMQAKIYGGLKPETKRYLLQVAAANAAQAQKPDAPKSNGEVQAPTRFRPGMRLLREWNGKTHVVDVQDKGFVWNGKLYSSLSPIARAITGTRWSGPRFFSP